MMEQKSLLHTSNGKFKELDPEVSEYISTLYDELKTTTFERDKIRLALMEKEIEERKTTNLYRFLIHLAYIFLAVCFLYFLVYSKQLI